MAGSLGRGPPAEQQRQTRMGHHQWWVRGKHEQNSRVPQGWSGKVPCRWWVTLVENLPVGEEGKVIPGSGMEVGTCVVYSGSSESSGEQGWVREEISDEAGKAA